MKLSFVSAGLAIGLIAAGTGCAHHHAQQAYVSTTTTTSAVVPAAHQVDVHLSPDLVGRCGTSAARGIAACLSRGPLRHERLQIVGRIHGGDDAERESEAALDRAERLKRYFIDEGVRPSQITTSAAFAGTEERRDAFEVDVMLLP